MSMKSTELELHKGKKITNALATKGNPFGSASAAAKAGGRPGRIGAAGGVMQRQPII